MKWRCAITMCVFLLVLLGLTEPARAIGNSGLGTAMVSPGYRTPPAPYVSLDMTYISADFAVHSQTPSCTVTIWIYGEHRGGGSPYHEYRLNQPMGPDRKCWGAYMDFAHPELSYPALFDAIKGIHIPYNRSSWTGTKPGDSCYVTVGVSYGTATQGVSAFPANCNSNSVPPPVNCVMDVPSLMQHATTPAGGGNASAHSSMHVSCTGRTTGRVSVSDGDVLLHGDGGTIRSRLYVGGEGHTEKNMVVDPSSTVDLISVIRRVGDVPGTYRGSGIVVFTWE